MYQDQNQRFKLPKQLLRGLALLCLVAGLELDLQAQRGKGGRGGADEGESATVDQDTTNRDSIEPQREVRILTEIFDLTGL